MKKFFEICVRDGAVSGWFCLLTTIVLLVASFILPPMGNIDSSVLAGAGELFAFATLFQIPNIIKSIKDGKSISLKHGATEVTVSSDNDKD